MKTKKQIEREIEKFQKVQEMYPPTSAIWQHASTMIHKLVAELTGKQNNDAWGKK